MRPPDTHHVVAAGSALLVLLVCASQGFAQVCVGGASFDRGSVAIGAGAAFDENSRGIGVDLTVGSAQGPFVTGSVSRFTYDDFDGSSVVYSASGGYAIPIDVARKVFLCPFLGVAFGDLPDLVFGDGSRLTLSSRSISGGLALGGAVPMSPTATLVPFVTMGYGTVTVTASAGGQKESDSEDGGNLTVGLGFVFNDNVALAPRFSIPVGIEDAKTSFGIGVTIYLGRAN